MYEYIDRFKRYGFGMFVHFGLYSVIGKGEWFLHTAKMSQDEYNSYADKFTPEKDWAKRLVKTAKEAGCRYITLTTRHHDGFSLYDTKGLSDFDTVRTACGRDLISEFTGECNKEGIIPFFYHTLLDWYNKDYENNFSRYIDYLVKSVEILCTNYGKIGGMWFDGMWNKPDADWQLDRLYGTIRGLQSEAMIINNTGLDAEGKTGHREIDSVTFERGTPTPVLRGNKPVAGEVCQGLTDHWGYCEEDVCFKTIPTVLDLLVDCRKYEHNLLLNTGLKGDGTITHIENEIFRGVGHVLKVNKNILLDGTPSDIKAEHADVFTDGKHYYAVIKNVPMCYNSNVTRMKDTHTVRILSDKKVVNAVWYDNDEKVRMNEDGSFLAWPFDYGYSYYIRIAKFDLE